MSKTSRAIKNRKQHSVLYVILGVLILGFTIMAAVSSLNSTYGKAEVTEVKRTYDKKSSGSKTRKYYAEVVVSLEYKGAIVTAETTVKESSERKLPGVGDTIDVQITDDGRVIATSRGKDILMSVVGVAGGGLLIWYGITNMIEAKKKKAETE
jgi:hypothetical protein